MNTIPISVIMSTYQYNKASYLKECLNSLNAQSSIADEIILIIDGPVDNDQMQIIERFKYLGTFKYYQLDKNRGLAYCMNQALQYSNNNIIARMDADDVCHYKRFEIEYEILRENINMVCCSWHAEFEKNIDKIDAIKKTPKYSSDINKSIAKRNIISHPTIMLYKNTLLQYGGYNENVGMLEDYELHLRLIHNGMSYYCIQEPLVYVRTDEKQYLRRSGLKYLFNEYKFRLACYKKGYISAKDLIITVFIYSLVRIFPVKYKHVLYKLVRTKVVI